MLWFATILNVYMSFCFPLTHPTEWYCKIMRSALILCIYESCTAHGTHLAASHAPLTSNSNKLIRTVSSHEDVVGLSTLTHCLFLQPVKQHRQHRYCHCMRCYAQAASQWCHSRALSHVSVAGHDSVGVYNANDHD